MVVALDSRLRPLGVVVCAIRSSAPRHCVEFSMASGWAKLHDGLACVSRFQPLASLFEVFKRLTGRGPTARPNVTPENVEWSMRILLVEDDMLLGDAVTSYLRRKGFAITRESTLAAAKHALLHAEWDAVLLDLRLPDGDGLSLMPSVAATAPETSVIILTARDQVSDRIAGLEAGADDYLVKPFDPDELVARLRAVERRRQVSSPPSLHLGDVCIDLLGMNVTRAGVPVTLTAKEWMLLRIMATRRHRVVRKEVLFDGLYTHGEEVESNTLEVFIYNLRRKLGTDCIETVRGAGYRLKRGELG